MVRTKACPACFEECVKRHGEEDTDPIHALLRAAASGPAPKESVAAEILPPSFLTKIMELPITNPLELPGSFVKSSVKRIGSTVVLEGPGREKWRVQTGPGKVNKSLQFNLDDWCKFVDDNFLQIGDQLSFTLILESHFQVVVYDGSGTQKLSATDARNSQATLQQLEAVGASVDQFRNKPSAKSKQKVYDGSDTQKLSATDARNSQATFQQPEAVGASVHQFRNKPSAKSKQKEHEGSSTQRKPTWTVVMTKTNLGSKSLLVMKNNFALKYLPRDNKKLITLQDIHGTKFPMHWNVQSFTLSVVEWRKFVTSHHLQVSDVCIFEVLEEFVFLVHIYRQGEDVEDQHPTIQPASQPPANRKPGSQQPASQPRIHA